jgi:putative polymerase
MKERYFTDPGKQPLAFWLVIAGVTFNLALCFIATHAHPVSQTDATVVEMAILAVGLAAIWRHLPTDLFCAAGLVAGWLMVVHLLNPELGQTAFVNLAIPVIFLVLGRIAGTPRTGDRLVLIVAVLTFAIGVLEMLDTALYEQIFNVLKYYIAKGVLKTSEAKVTGTDLFVSSIRPAGEGRSLIPALGPLRAGSIFLEPISVGNCAIICAAWGFVRHRVRPRFAIAVVALGLGIAVLADSRQAVGCIAIIAIALATPLPQSRGCLLMFPFCTIAYLLWVGWTHPVRLVDDTFGGRIYGAGTTLASYGLPDWLGIVVPPERAVDCGYAQAMEGLGIIPLSLIWAVFALWRSDSVLFNRFRCALVVYLCISLTITGSVLSIKTGALAWFLLGASLMDYERKASMRLSARIAPAWARGRAAALRPIRKPATL